MFHVEAHCILRGSSFPARPLILVAKGQGSESKGGTSQGRVGAFLSDAFTVFCENVQQSGRGVLPYPNDGSFLKKDLLLQLAQLSRPGLLEGHIIFPHMDGKLPGKQR